MSGLGVYGTLLVRCISTIIRLGHGSQLLQVGETKEASGFSELRQVQKPRHLNARTTEPSLASEVTHAAHAEVIKGHRTWTGHVLVLYF